jgi:hypothetical protein
MHALVTRRPQLNVPAPRVNVAQNLLGPYCTSDVGLGLPSEIWPLLRTLLYVLQKILESDVCCELGLPQSDNRSAEVQEFPRTDLSDVAPMQRVSSSWGVPQAETTLVCETGVSSCFALAGKHKY